MAIRSEHRIHTVFQQPFRLALRCLSIITCQRGKVHLQQDAPRNDGLVVVLPEVAVALWMREYRRKAGHLYE